MADRSHLTLRLPRTLRDRLDRAAGREDRSLNRQIVRYIRDGLARDGAQDSRDTRDDER